MLKQTIFSVLVLCAMLPSIGAHAQKVRLNLYSAYAFDDKFDSYYSSSNYYQSKLIGGLQWGGGIEYMARPDLGVEVLYLRQSTNAPTTYAISSITTNQTDFNIDLNYILLGSSF